MQAQTALDRTTKLCELTPTTLEEYVNALTQLQEAIGSLYVGVESAAATLAYNGRLCAGYSLRRVLRRLDVYRQINVEPPKDQKLVAAAVDANTNEALMLAHGKDRMSAIEALSAYQGALRELEQKFIDMIGECESLAIDSAASEFNARIRSSKRQLEPESIKGVWELMLQQVLRKVEELALLPAPAMQDAYEAGASVIHECFRQMLDATPWGSKESGQ
jgi:hypothetical protein